MSSRRVQPLVLLAAAGALVFLAQGLHPQYHHRRVDGWETVIGGVPDPVVFGVVTVLTIGVWVALLVVLARSLYLVWQRVDGYVLSLWDVLLPENPIIRVGVGITLMLFLFVIGPMVIIQEAGLLEDEEGIDLEGNQTDDEGTPTPTPTPSDSLTGQPTDSPYRPAAYSTASIG